METQMPGLSKKADEMTRPEATPENIGRIHNGVSVELSDDNSYMINTDDFD